jgi:hypothetical protein
LDDIRDEFYDNKNLSLISTIDKDLSDSEYDSDYLTMLK